MLTLTFIIASLALVLSLVTFFGCPRYEELNIVKENLTSKITETGIESKERDEKIKKSLELFPKSFHVDYINQSIKDLYSKIEKKPVKREKKK